MGQVPRRHCQRDAHLEDQLLVHGLERRWQAAANAVVRRRRRDLSPEMRGARHQGLPGFCNGLIQPVATRSRRQNVIENPYYSQEGHGPSELHHIGDLDLEEGGTICGCRLAVATHGKLNAAKNNAILVPAWYSGASKIIEQVYIGKGRGLDCL